MKNHDHGHAPLTAEQHAFPEQMQSFDKGLCEVLEPLITVKLSHDRLVRSLAVVEAGGESLLIADEIRAILEHSDAGWKR